MGVHVCVLILLYVSVASSQSYGICSTIKNTDACQQLDRSSDIKCIQHVNTVGCILSIENGTTSFGRLTAEEALLAASLTSNIRVVGEFISETNQADEADYAIVVVARKNSTNGFGGLKGLKYCHPGFDMTDVTLRVLREFETAVLKNAKVDVCLSDVETLIEKHIKAVAEYFGPSCRPGQWVEDKQLDKKLKEKYSTLTQLCDSTSYQTNKGRPFRQSLNCLTSGSGDVAITTLSEVKKIIEENQNATTDYEYVCRSDLVNPLNQTCSWIRQPWSLLVANANSAAKLSQDLSEWFVGQTIGNPSASPRLEKPYVPHLKSVLEFSDTMRINITSGQPLKDYIAAFRVIPDLDQSKLCKREIRWCTTSEDERRKCKWFSQAGLNYGLRPVISCVRRTSKLDCINAVENTSADIVAVEADLAYPAARKNLSAIAFPETKESKILRSVLVIKPKFETLENQIGLRGCLPVYGGVAWTSFADFLPKISCDYGKRVSEFLGDSCVPGAIEQRQDMPEDTQVEKLCALCNGHPIYAPTAFYCNANSNNLNYGNEGALQCFDGIGDLAVITITSDSVPSVGNYTVLCRDGSRIANIRLADVDKNCYLSTVNPSAIITRRNDHMNEDVRLALLEIDRHFARNLKAPFKLFDDFNGAKDLLFQDSTLGIDSLSSENDGVKGYLQLFSRVDSCKQNEDYEDSGGSGNRITKMSTVVLFILAILV